MTQAAEQAIAEAAPANDHRAVAGPYYTARCGIIWSPLGPRLISDAEEHARDFLDMALSERDPEHAAGWMRQLTNLVAAIREAKLQAAERPIDLDPARPDYFAFAVAVSGAAA